MLKVDQSVLETDTHYVKIFTSQFTIKDEDCAAQNLVFAQIRNVTEGMGNEQQTRTLVAHEMRTPFGLI